MKIKLTLEYDGTGFFGWQKQDNFRSVQGTVEQAIEKVFGERQQVELFGAGRTDTGVHATGQVAHFSIVDEALAKQWTRDIAKLPFAINFYLLDAGVVVLGAEVVPDDFHARFSATMRHYRYVIFNRHTKSVIHEKRAWHVAKPLDVAAMNDAAQSLLGTHNLNAFRSAHCNAQNPVRTISGIKVYKTGDFIVMDISARSFLHNQVRITIGTLKQIGEGKFPVHYILELLEKQDRRAAGITAPPHGLYLTEVEYQSLDTDYAKMIRVKPKKDTVNVDCNL